MPTEDTTRLDAALEHRLTVIAEVQAALSADAWGPQESWIYVQRATQQLRAISGRLSEYGQTHARLRRRFSDLSQTLENPLIADPTSVKDDLAEARATRDALEHLDGAMEKLKAMQVRSRQSLEEAIDTYRRRAHTFLSRQIGPFEPRVEHGPGGQEIIRDDEDRRAARKPLESLRARLAEF